MKNKWFYGILASAVVVGLIVALMREPDSDKKWSDLYEDLEDYFGC